MKSKVTGWTHLEDVLMNAMVNESINLYKIDMSFVSFGLHDWGFWQKPYGKTYRDQFVSKLQNVKQPAMPSIWVSSNNNCPDKVLMHHSIMGKNHMKEQPIMIEEANLYMIKYARDNNISYFDAANVLRTPGICDVSDDGLHVKMWVDIFRTQVLFNHLCNENYEWVGGSNSFKVS